MTVLQTTRWNEVIERARQRGNEYGLSSQFTEKIFHAIHEESIAKQEEILNG
jgi:chorismate mutase